MSIFASGDLAGERYTIEGEVGRGGMQEVYRAHDDTLQRTVALKVPQDARAARRFKESATLSARVNHPNIARTLDYFEEQDRFFLVEEFIDGMNLRQVMNQFARLDPYLAAHLLHHLARGVAACHRVGVVHRDLKPSNVMIQGGLNFSALKITDFGIAKMAEHELNEAISGNEETTKRSSTVMNALAYIAPEIIEDSRSPSMAADVWAVAAITWEALTGAPPFGAGLKALREVLRGVPPTLPTTISNHQQFGSLSKEIASLLLSCFQSDPLQRPTAQGLATRCDSLCYLPPVRETGTIQGYKYNAYGFIQADRGGGVFFHRQNVVADNSAPPIGTRVWFSKFEGQPSARAFPVLPMVPQD